MYVFGFDEADRTLSYSFLIAIHEIVIWWELFDPPIFMGMAA